MKFVTTLYIECDAPDDVANEVRQFSGRDKLGLCETMTEDMIGVINDNVQAKKNLKVKGQTIIKDFKVVNELM